MRRHPQQSRPIFFSLSTRALSFKPRPHHRICGLVTRAARGPEDALFVAEQFCAALREAGLADSLLDYVARPEVVADGVAGVSTLELPSLRVVRENHAELEPEPETEPETDEPDMKVEPDIKAEPAVPMAADEVWLGAGPAALPSLAEKEQLAGLVEAGSDGLWREDSVRCGPPQHGL